MNRNASSSDSLATPKIVVVVVNWNGRQDTLRCLGSLRSVSDAHSVIVVDNGSSDDSVVAISQAFPEVEIIATGENLGYAAGNNVGIRRALEQFADFILVLNNDTTVDNDLFTAFRRHDLPIQGGMILQMQNPSRIDQLGGRWNPSTGKYDAVALNAAAEDWKHPLVLDYVSGAALFVQADLFREVGLFDPRFFLFWEECDWCARAARLGYPATVCPDARIYHRGSASFVGGLPHTTYYWWRNRLLWIELNCTASERRRLQTKCLFETLPTLRRYFLKLLQSLVARTTDARQLRLKTYRAELAGVHDYYRRRFGPGPTWLAAEK